MPDVAPTEEQQRILREGTDQEKIALLSDPNVGDNVRLLSKTSTLPRVVEAAIDGALADETLIELSDGGTDWVARRALSRLKSKANLLHPVFAKNPSASVRADVAENVESDDDRVKFLVKENGDPESPVVRAGVYKGLRSLDELRKGLEREKGKNGLIGTINVRIQVLTEHPELQTPQPRTIRAPHPPVTPAGEPQLG